MQSVDTYRTYGFCFSTVVNLVRTNNVCINIIRWFENLNWITKFFQQIFFVFSNQKLPFLLCKAFGSSGRDSSSFCRCCMRACRISTFLGVLALDSRRSEEKFRIRNYNSRILVWLLYVHSMYIGSRDLKWIFQICTVTVLLPMFNFLGGVGNEFTELS
jgi:hypothetical protein